MEADPVGLSEEYRALLRRDWAVRVLDAWAALDDSWDDAICPRHRYDFYEGREDQRWEIWVGTGRNQGEEKGSVQYFATPDAARLAAAKAVYPTLPDTVRAQLGEAPY